LIVLDVIEPPLHAACRARQAGGTHNRIAGRDKPAPSPSMVSEAYLSWLQCEESFKTFPKAKPLDWRQEVGKTGRTAIHHVQSGT
jgi:hypothetical protein